MLDRLLRGAGGELRVRVTGASLERFLNLCLREGIRLRALERQDWDRLECTLTLTDFRRLRGRMGRTGCRVHIIRREGLPFVLRALQRRIVFSAGFFALFAVLWLLNSRIWVIELRTPPEVSSAAVSRALTEEGVTVGMPIEAFDGRTVQRRLLLRLDDISYVTFNRTGNHLIVDAYAKRDHAPARSDDSITSVVARRPGQIVRVTPESGWAVVKKGDIVDTGEKLIDALVPPSRDIEGLTPRLTWSGGEVIARTWYQKTVLRPMTVPHKQYTGKTTTQYALIWGKHRINFYLGSGICGAGCDKIIDIHYLTVTDGLTLPAALVRQTYRWYGMEETTADPEALRQALEARALEALEREVRGEITAHTASAEETEAGALAVRFSAEALEDIGETVEDGQALPPPEAEEPQ